MSRRAACLIALVATWGVFGTAAEAAPKLPFCPVVEDATGDTDDSGLDITRATYAKVGKTLAVTIGVERLPAFANTAPGDQFDALFTASGKKVQVFSKRSRTGALEGTQFFQKGLRVDNVFISDVGIDAKYDLGASTVTISITLGALSAGVGKPVDGSVIGALGAASLRGLVARTLPADSAESTKTFRVAPCRA